MPSEEAPQQGLSVGLQNGHVQDGHVSTDQEKSSEESLSMQSDQKAHSQDKQKQPAGGFDSTPVPYAPPGYTIKITFHRATNLLMADLNSLSSDPYISAQIHTALQPRHEEEPYLRCRTPTVRRTTDPVWNWSWIVANIPASGFKLKARIYDEDTADKDDRLGRVYLDVPSVSEEWGGITDHGFKIKKSRASKRAYLMRAVAVSFNRAKHMTGDMYISVEVLGKTEGEEGGCAYTVGPNYWLRHFSPMLGRITGRTEPGDDEPGQGSDKKKTERYNFQANQFQLQGPVPAELYHRYVEFKAFVKSMFTAKGFRGYLLSKALHHQHRHVYNFASSTTWGVFNHPCKEMTLQFLDLVHYDRGGRIFTYVLTLDSLLRFTETGKEFGIDLLSKHTMHSDVSVYIAFSGEFFIRRLKHPHRTQNSKQSLQEEETSPDDHPPKDPAYYELVIDNDSGTYRPNGKLLPLLKQFLSRNFPGIKILTLDTQADAERMKRMKDEQRERKKKEGDQVVFKQGSTGSSISSSDEEDLDRMAQGGKPEEHRTCQKAGRAIEETKKGQLQHALHGKRPEGDKDGDDRPQQLVKDLQTQTREGENSKQSGQGNTT